MITAKQTAKLVTQAMPSYFVLAVIYIALLFLLPADPVTIKAYNFTPIAYHVVHFGVAMPAMLTWFAAFVAYDMLRKYAYSIRKTPEGSHFAQLARGSTWLAWSLPISAITALILSAISNQWDGFQGATTIINNYLNLVLPLVAFTIIGSASRGLLNDAKLRYNIISSRVLMLLFVMLGVLFCYFTFRHFDLSGLGTTNNPYHLPVWLTVLTVTVPSLYAWFVGLLAAYEINIFSKNVRGLLYRQALRLLMAGLIIVIGSLIALQYINGIRPHASHLVLDFKLLVVLIFRILGGVGFAIMTLGAVRLKKIEEV